MKRMILFLLCISLILPCAFVSAESSAVDAVLSVSEADSDGNVTVSVTVKNAVFQVVQVSFRYDTEEFELTNDNIKAMTTGKPVGVDIEDKLLTQIKRSHDSEKGLFTYVGMSNLSYFGDEKYMNENNGVVADESGIEIFSLKLKKKTDGDYNIGFAKEDGGVFDPINPKGIALALSGKELAVNTVLKLPGKEEVVEIITPSAPVKSEEQQRKERIKDSLILQIGNYAATDDGTLCYIDKDNKAVMPYIKNDRTMVPLRFVAESFGLEVSWKGETKEIVMTDENTNLIMQIGNKTYTKNGTEALMDAEPELTQADRTFVPLRAVAEAFGKSVHWFENQSCVIIVPDDRPWDEKNKTEQRLLQDALLIMSPLIRDMN